MWDWNEAKRQANLAKHGVDFAEIALFEWAFANVWTDNRFDYGEERKSALGLINGRVYCAIYTKRGPVNWLISLRKANERERERWNTAVR